jgi:hypothetical protein
VARRAAAAGNGPVPLLGRRRTGAVAGGPRSGCRGVRAPDSERRPLHAKLLLLESDAWLAAMIGSSNATKAGFGLDQRRGHHELNMWLGCPAGSRTAKHLRALSCAGDRIAPDEGCWEPPRDEDEPTTPVLPLGFVTSIVDAGTPPRAVLELDAHRLPAVWEVRTPAGHVLLTDQAWHAAGASGSHVVGLPDDVLPAYLLVGWEAGGESFQGTWTANVADRSALPPPAELAQLPVDLLLAALASSRPLPLALEQELRRRERAGIDGSRVDLDPLRRFDDTGLLLQRARHYSLALWRLQHRLSRPATSLDALHWRLHGAFGPLAIADGLVRATGEQQMLPGEAHFLLAELALTISGVDWRQVASTADPRRVRHLVSDVLASITERQGALPPPPDMALDAYVCSALEAAQS